MGQIPRSKERIYRNNNNNNSIDYRIWLNHCTDIKDAVLNTVYSITVLC